jgi:hypothetical protein
MFPECDSSPDTKGKGGPEIDNRTLSLTSIRHRIDTSSSSGTASDGKGFVRRSGIFPGNAAAWVPIIAAKENP